MDGIHLDIVHRALAELQGFCSAFEQAKEEQRVKDLRAEIANRQRRVEELEQTRDDALKAANIVREHSPALAMAFGHYAAILLEETERIRPHGLWKKLQEAEQHHRDVRLLADILDKTELEFLCE